MVEILTQFSDYGALIVVSAALIHVNYRFLRREWDTADKRETRIENLEKRVDDLQTEFRERTYPIIARNSELFERLISRSP